MESSETRACFGPGLEFQEGVGGATPVLKHTVEAGLDPSQDSLVLTDGASLRAPSSGRSSMICIPSSVHSSALTKGLLCARPVLEVQ